MIYLLILLGEQVISLDILQEPQQQKRFQKKKKQPRKFNKQCLLLLALYSLLEKKILFSVQPHQFKTFVTFASHKLKLLKQKTRNII